MENSRKIDHACSSRPRNSLCINVLVVTEPVLNSPTYVFHRKKNVKYYGERFGHNKGPTCKDKERYFIYALTSNMSTERIPAFFIMSDHIRILQLCFALNTYKTIFLF